MLVRNSTQTPINVHIHIINAIKQHISALTIKGVDVILFAINIYIYTYLCTSLKMDLN